MTAKATIDASLLIGSKGKEVTIPLHAEYPPQEGKSFTFAYNPKPGEELVLDIPEFLEWACTTLGIDKSIEKTLEDLLKVQIKVDELKYSQEDFKINVEIGKKAADANSEWNTEPWNLLPGIALSTVKLNFEKTKD
ncbi:MAG: hypothetical protein KAX49_08105 [Halanaerobiales bacterium]|nr:hypothetical protein [Halanaerobiales bacterium]